jgi:hypothetical protein
MKHTTNHRHKHEPKGKDSLSEEPDYARKEPQDHPTVGVQPIQQFSLNDQISYKWLFDVELRPPLQYAALPFSDPIPQEVNS